MLSPKQISCYSNSSAISFIDIIHCCFFVFYPIIPIRRIFCIIHHDLDLFHDIYDTINEHNQRQTCCLFSIQIILISIFDLSESKNHFIFSSTSSFTCSASWSMMEEVKSFDIVNLIFHGWDFLRLLIISFKYGLILLRYSSTDRVLFLSPFYFRIQYNFCSENYSLWLVYNNFLLLHAQKNS